MSNRKLGLILASFMIAMIPAWIIFHVIFFPPAEQRRLIEQSFRTKERPESRRKFKPRTEATDDARSPSASVDKKEASEANVPPAAQKAAPSSPIAPAKKQ